jgi:hypothetical protein
MTRSLTKNYPGDKFKKRWAGHVARMRDRGSAYMILVGKPGEKGQLGRPRRRWDVNIKMYLQEI